MNVTQVQKYLVLYKGSEVHTVIDSPGATTSFDAKVFTYAEGDDLQALMAGKTKPPDEKLRVLINDMATVGGVKVSREEFKTAERQKLL